MDILTGDRTIPVDCCYSMNEDVRTFAHIRCSKRCSIFVGDFGPAMPLHKILGGDEGIGA